MCCETQGTGGPTRRPHEFLVRLPHVTFTGGQPPRLPSWDSWKTTGIPGPPELCVLTVSVSETRLCIGLSHRLLHPICNPPASTEARATRSTPQQERCLPSWPAGLGRAGAHRATGATVTRSTYWPTRSHVYLRGCPRRRPGERTCQTAQSFDACCVTSYWTPVCCPRTIIPPRLFKVKDTVLPSVRTVREQTKPRTQYQTCGSRRSCQIPCNCATALNAKRSSKLRRNSAQPTCVGCADRDLLAGRGESHSATKVFFTTGRSTAMSECHIGICTHTVFELIH
mmetsp:Transcript_16865/g.42975  ORF Transcript_16865/g.42975 Transcript_16865/m.42975 type:complete len:283 (+) Transcript_16865:403-1251(+)